MRTSPSEKNSQVQTCVIFKIKLPLITSSVMLFIDPYYTVACMVEALR